MATEDIKMKDSAGSPEEEYTFKRKRTMTACHRCRSIKSKCDGRHPTCGRCEGYGYACSYPPPGRIRRPNNSAAVNIPANIVAARLDELRKAVCNYNAFVDDLLTDNISSAVQEPLQSRHAGITTQINAIFKDLETILPESSTSSSKPETSSVDLHSGPPQSPRYLGEVSDVRYFNWVKQILQFHGGASQLRQEYDSYEQNESTISSESRVAKVIALPDPETADQLFSIYFSTVHLAFPFIQQSVFKQSYSTVRSLPCERMYPDTTGLALIYIVCAIGRLYASFSDEQNRADKSHELYFLRALTIAPPTGRDRSINYVSFLLAQCFYLLAVCRTDSCWATLGQAVRTAQSIGLHVEDETSSDKDVHVEKRRRLWYCIYSLDHLVSLQLGRPPAIHHCDFRVPLPSRAWDSDIDWENNDFPADVGEPSLGDYFLGLIDFSKIIGHILHDLYNPNKMHGTSSALLNTKSLDQEVVRWKLSLPRYLRFDLGHAFDQSALFKRQRNMLALKYHHLRGLIHRPYLCFPLLKHSEESLSETECGLIRSYERICILEARETARLLHSVSEGREMVYNFPWWQTISCLVCAASILFVSSVFTQPTEDSLESYDSTTLQDDAETCLRVFEGLSITSTGARIARDMMESLKDCGFKWKLSNLEIDQTKPVLTEQYEGANLSRAVVQVVAPDSFSEDISVVDSVDSDWPAELMDSMTWSARFLGL